MDAAEVIRSRKKNRPDSFEESGRFFSGYEKGISTISDLVFRRATSPFWRLCSSLLHYLGTLWSYVPDLKNSYEPHFPSRSYIEFHLPSQWLRQPT